MKKEIKPSEVKGRVQAPPSKSYAQRAIAVAAFADGISVIHFPGNSDDVNAAINVTRQFGAEVVVKDNTVIVKGGINAPEDALDCGEAGLSIRMFSCVAGIFNRPVVLTGSGSLLDRPMHVVEDSLRAMGVRCTTSRGFLPLTVQGPIKGGIAEVDGSFSSQVLTGMLIAAPFAERDLTIRVKNLTSRPYIDITLEVMNSFGVKVENTGYSEFFIKSRQNYKPSIYRIEGDWSAAAFLLVAGAIGGQVTVDNIDGDSVQADRAILDALKSAGAVVSVGEQSVNVVKGELRAFEFDATHCPDLFPPLVSLASWCQGETKIKGVGRLIHKESNRAATLQEEFGKLGIKILYDSDIMTIQGGGFNGGNVNSHGDHRIAMACAVAAINSVTPVIVEGAEAVAKSYPAFYDDLGSITSVNR